MSAATVKPSGINWSEFSRQVKGLDASMRACRFSLGLSLLRFNNAFLGRGERDRAQRELAFGQREADRDPSVQAICVTTNEGRCRVVVRRLGGWS